MNEPTITINGIALSNAQAMTVRVAICDFQDQMSAQNGPMANAYEARLAEIINIMFPVDTSQ